MEQLFEEFVRAIYRVDAQVVELVVDLRSPLLTKVMNSVTGLGSASAGLVFIGLFHLAGWREEFRVTLVALALSGVIVAALMVAVQRPYPPQPVCQTGGAETVAHSFPSGHAAAVAVYATVARRSEVLPFAIVAIFAVTVAVSRFYLGTHYFSDTVVGVLIGVGTVLVAERLLGSDRFAIPFLTGERA
ncbi:Membrane-associated phospholipid phosphatase [Halapricum desulfuricans]|uniref:Membrane-associated phospholipid phosphatase n=1 Tax=Halapricum desulfuricans TaxID=2841257 RepID=A0A897NL94_9EURY|nr:phosphatase PAP2 family protein [Halapricum desulfuricans]QSG13051.1 Membrane-associated phospholipid phosphatase [Halapricum desulfuricans]